MWYILNKSLHYIPSWNTHHISLAVNSP